MFYNINMLLVARLRFKGTTNNWNMQIKNVFFVK